MALWDNVSAIGKQAATKARDMADYTLKMGEIHSEEQKLDDCYKRIGKRIYESLQATPPAEDLDDFNEIEMHIANIKRLNDELQELKGKKPCPICGEMTDKDDAFCGHCGNKI